MACSGVAKGVVILKFASGLLVFDGVDTDPACVLVPSSSSSVRKRN